MPLGTRTWIYTKSVVRLERDEYGVYELLDSFRDIIYIGYGKISNALLTHFAEGAFPIPDVMHFSVEYTWTEEKARTRYLEELARFFKIHSRYPQFNP